MQLIKVEIADFGNLDGVFEFKPQACNVLCAANEFGKSTLVDAILFSLYPPPKTGARNVLKPLERYRPWDEDKDTKPRLKLHLEWGDPPRRYCIEAVLGKQLRYTLIDTETNHTSPLPNNSFGESKLGLSLEACMRSFLLRQDGMLGNDDSGVALQGVIERAVSAATVPQGVSVQEALKLLDNVEVPVDGKSLKLKTVISRKQEELEKLERERRDCEQERAKQAGSLRELETLQSQIQQLQKQVTELERATVRARIDEIEELLREQARRAKEHAEKLEKKKRLEPYAHYTHEKYAELKKLWGELSSRRAQLEKQRTEFQNKVAEPLAWLERELAGYPPSIAKLTDAESAELKRLNVTLAEQERDLKELEQQIATIEKELEENDVNVEHALNLEKQLSLLSGEELRLVLGGYQQSKGDLERSLQEALQRLAQAQQQCDELDKKLTATSRWSTAWFALALLAGAAMVGGLLYGLTPAIYAGAAAALVTAVIGTIFLVRRSNLRELHLRPARESLASSQSAANELRTKLDELERQFDGVRRKARLQTSDLLDLERYRPHNRAVATIVSNRERRKTLSERREENLQRAIEIARCIDPNIDANPTIERLRQCEVTLDHYLKARRDHATLAQEKLSREEALREEERQLAEIEKRITAILDEAGTPADSMERRIEKYGSYLDHAKRYHELVAQLESYQILPPEKLKLLEDEKQQLLEKLRNFGEETKDVARGERREKTSRHVLEEMLDRARRELEAKQAAHQTLLLQCDRVMEHYRKRVPELEELIARKRESLRRLEQTQEAISLAREAMAQLHVDVARSWQRALKEKLEEFLPRLLPRYEQPGVLDNLELTLRDKETGKILHGAKELGYLSKGTRDQLDFLLRIAIGEVLTNHCGPLPLILDEPFAHWDDDRFTQGVQFLVELAKQRQVLLLTCHRWRFEYLENTYPGIFHNLHLISAS